ncbi:MAG: hypothetical protein ACFB15_29925 [Cyclobacteriaceae bacterium]
MKMLSLLIVLTALFACDPENVNPNNPDNAAARISGSAFHIYTSPGPWSDSSTSSYHKVDFCPNGHFMRFFETSLIVKGGPRNYNGEPVTGVYAASNGLTSGTWSIAEVNGQSWLVLQFDEGFTWTYELAKIMEGGWKEGRTRFAMDWGKGVCR